MNFQELLNRMKELDRPVLEEPNEGNAYGQAVQNTPPGKEIKINGKGTGDIKREEMIANGCGSDMTSLGQQDSVSMNVNMSGSGSGGIRDLINILKNIEGEHGGGGNLRDLIGKMDHPHDDEHDDMGMRKTVVIGDNVPVDEYANEPDETMMPLPMAGNDLHKPHGNYPATQLGDNPMAVARIRENLQKLYQKYQ
jgi:hypothetical protein